METQSKPGLPGDDFADRVARAIDATGLSMDDLAARLGDRNVPTSRRTLTNYKSGSTFPNEARRRTIIEAIESIAEEEHRPDDSDLVRVPVLAVECAAGNGSDVDELDEHAHATLALPRAFVRAEFGVPPDRLRTLRVRGDSMTPTILPGSSIVVSIWHGEPLVDGSVYVLSVPTGLSVKRLKLDRDRVLVTSDNDEYDPVEVPFDEFQRDYRVLAQALATTVRL